MIHVVFSDELGGAWEGGASQLEVTVMNLHKQPRRPRTRRTERRSLTLRTPFFEVVFPPCASWPTHSGWGAPPHHLLLQ